MNKIYGTGPINPQNDNSRTKIFRGSAGEGSPDGKRQTRGKRNTIFNTRLPLYFYIFGESIVILLLSLFIVGVGGWDYIVTGLASIMVCETREVANTIITLFVILALVIIVTGALVARAIYNAYWYGDGIFDHLTRRM